MTFALGVREMTSEDLPAVAALSGQLGYPVTLAQLEPRFDWIRRTPYEELFVAEMPDGSIAGWIHVGADPSLTHDSVAEIKGLIVGESHRGQGLGEELVGAAEAWCLRHGFRNVRVRSRVEREAAHGFYQRRGYQRQKTQHVFLRRLG
jgi:GNAT superfamily N-acetyltransferase